jgi:DNA-binding MarR family transcriptional regulator
MKKTIRYTNRTRLGFFRNVYEVGNIALTAESIENEKRRIQESSFSSQSNAAEFKEVSNSITEEQFYTMYLTMLSTANSFTNTPENKKPLLTSTHIMYLAALMAKPLDYTIPTNSKSNKLTELAEELKRGSQSIYNSIHKLKKDEWIYITEDSNLRLNNVLENLRTIVKTQLEINGGIAIWDTLFRYVINDRPYNRENNG